MNNLLTVVTATVAAERETELIAAYAELVDGMKPDGLVHSALLQGQDGDWEVHTLWRDRAALDAMRATVATPPAITLFQSVDAQPNVAILTVRAATD